MVALVVLNLSRLKLSRTAIKKSNRLSWLHKLAKAAMVVSRFGTDTVSEVWYQKNLDSVIGDLTQAIKYAEEVPLQRRSYEGCISRERGR
jgi:hypothetical protein